MRTPIFTGSCPALVTPFDGHGAINYDAFGKLIDSQIEAGVDAVCVCGTTGESATMSIREHITAVEFCVKRVDHRVKVIAGAGSNDTAAAQLQIKYMDLIDALFCEVNPIPIKAAMNLMGMEAGPLHLPLCDISDKNLAVLRASMEWMGLL